jgi:hypothetical protein
MKQRSPVVLLVAIGAGIGAGGKLTAQVQPVEDPPVADQSAADQSATDRALEELSTAYEGLAGLFNQGSGEAVNRVQEDIENLGDWEYRIVEVPNGSAEMQEQRLNELGNERWEVYWVQPATDKVWFYLKRPSISYLSRVPLSTLLRVIAGGQ